MLAILLAVLVGLVALFWALKRRHEPAYPGCRRERALHHRHARARRHVSPVHGFGLQRPLTRRPPPRRSHGSASASP